MFLLVMSSDAGFLFLQSQATSQDGQLLPLHIWRNAPGCSIGFTSGNTVYALLNGQHNTHNVKLKRQRKQSLCVCVCVGGGGGGGYRCLCVYVYVTGVCV